MSIFIYITSFYRYRKFACLVWTACMSLLLVSAAHIANRIRGSKLKKLDLVGEPEIRALEEASDLLRRARPSVWSCAALEPLQMTRLGEPGMARCLCAELARAELLVVLQLGSD